MNAPAIFRKQWIAYLPLGMLAVACLALGMHKPLGDFGNYYYASRFLAEGRWGVWVSDPGSFNAAVLLEGERTFLNYTPVPPLSALIYVPFTWFNVTQARLGWNIFNIVLLCISLYRLQRFFRIDPRWLWLVPVLVFVPVRNTIFEGQSYFLLFFLLGEGLLRYLKHEYWAAVFLWALAVHLKVSPAFVLLFLLSCKDWKSALKLGGCTLLLFVISLPFLGIATWSNYVTGILPRLFNGEINDPYASNYQSMQVLLRRLFVPDTLLNPEAPFNSTFLFYSLSAAFSIMIYGLTFLSQQATVKKELRFGLWLMASLLTSGYGNSFSLLLLLIPLCGAYAELGIQRPLAWLMVLLVAAACNLPVSWVAHWPLLLQFPRLYLLLLLFGCFVFITRPAIRYGYAVLLLAAFLAPVRDLSNDQNYFLSKEPAMLIYNMKPRQDALVIYTWGVSGPVRKIIPWTFTVRKVEQADFSGSHGEQVSVAYVLNDSLLIYLSDKNRGAGFYTVRFKTPNTRE